MVIYHNFSILNYKCKKEVFILINKKNKYLILFIVFLVGSLTPASATIMGEAEGNNYFTDPLHDIIANATGNNNNTLGPVPEIENYQNQIERLTLLMKNDADELNVTVEKIMYDIEHLKFIDMFNKVDKAKKLSNDLNIKTKNLESVTKNLEIALNQSNNTENNVNDVNDVEPGDSNGDLDAQDMAAKLQTRLNTPFSVDHPTLLDYDPGDIVQYKDNKGYYRYLMVHNITPHSTIYLEGKDHKILILTWDKVNSVSCRLTPSTEVDSYTLVDTAYNIQSDDIQKLDDKAQDKITHGKQIQSNGKTLEYAGIGIIALSVTVYIITFVVALIPLLDLATPGLALVGSTILAIGVALITAAYIIIDTGERRVNDGKKIEATAAAELDDLEHFMPNAHIPVAHDMNITVTKDGNWTGAFNVTDPDNDVVDSCIHSPRWGSAYYNGSNFTYFTRFDFVGKDNFSYKVVDKEGLISNVAWVNILVVDGTSGNVTLKETGKNFTYDTTRNTPLNINISSNYKIVFFQQPLNGNVTVNNSVFGYQSICYIPFKDFLGTDSFSYRLQSSEGNMSDIAWINITVKESFDILQT